MVGAAHSFMPARLSLAGAAVDVESIGVSAAKVAITEESIVIKFAWCLFYLLSLVRNLSGRRCSAS